MGDTELDQSTFRRYLREQGLDEDMPDAGDGLDEIAPGPGLGPVFGPTLADAPVEIPEPPELPEEPPAMVAPRQAQGYAPTKLPSQSPIAANGLDEAQRSDETRRGFNDTSDALAAAFARRPVPQAHQPQGARDFTALEAFREREKAKQQQAAEDSPDSESNVTARAAFASTPIGAAIAQKMGPAFDRLTTKNMPIMAQLARMGRERQPDTNAADRLALQRETEARKAATEAEKLKLGREKMMSAAELAKARLEAAKDSASRRAALAANAKTEKQKGADALLAIPGWDASPDVKVKPEVAQKLRDTVAGQKTIESTVDGIEKLFKQYGNQPLPGPAKSKMQGLLTDLQLNLKGESQFGLGVLTGPDLALLEKVTGDPTRVGNTLLDYFSEGENTLAKLAEVRNQSRQRFENRLNASGYTRRKEKPSGVPPGAVKAERDTETGEVRYLDASGKVL